MIIEREELNDILIFPYTACNTSIQKSTLPDDLSVVGLAGELDGGPVLFAVRLQAVSLIVYCLLCLDFVFPDT
jgi:hypothetical protein